MLKTRSSGILAHITSLPSPFGIGDIGHSSYAFIDFLVACGQSYWQFLPTGPTKSHFDHSPYMSTSAFAGNPLLISPDLLFQKNLISRDDLQSRPDFSQYITNFAEVSKYKGKLLRRAFLQFQSKPCMEYQNFLETTPWLDDYAAFMVLKDLYHDKGWCQWSHGFATHCKDSLQSFSTKHSEAIDYYRFEQYEFFNQWKLLRQYAINQGVFLIGDLPIYVSYDSVDVWTHQTIFSLDHTTLLPTKVSGVPPDYFSSTGQRWGNPLYEWQRKNDTVKQELMDWWTARLANIFDLVDVTRIDHFRGFESFWAIPEEHETAMHGEWLKGPGIDFFKKVEERLGPLNIIAEDLGIITPEVEKLRDDLGFPGMKVLQFAFDNNSNNSFLPCNFQSPHCIVYTGTHDNDTTVGWYLSEKMNDSLRTTIKKMANRTLADHNSIHHDLMYLALSSIARLCIFPLQDVLGFGNDCKMNSPGIAKGNWRWRCAQEFLSPQVAEQLQAATSLFGRGRKNKNSSTLE